MQKKILLSGSLAFDHLYRFPRTFGDQLVATARSALNASFNVEDKAIHFGGCAGNIAYNARLLGEDFVLLGIAGKDFGDYETWLKKKGISTDCVIRVPACDTSHAVVATDARGQQITFFYSGAATLSAQYKKRIESIVHRLRTRLIFAHIAPNHPDFMRATISACTKSKLPYFFDPGQAIGEFSSNELRNYISHAAGLFVNEYEHSILRRNTGLSGAQLRALCPLIIQTQSGKGSVIYFGRDCIRVPAIKPAKIVDPTGCGDAYRAGFLSVIKVHFPKLTRPVLERAGAVGTKLATACLQDMGTQNHDLGTCAQVLLV